MHTRRHFPSDITTMNFLSHLVFRGQGIDRDVPEPGGCLQYSGKEAGWERECGQPEQQRRMSSSSPFIEVFHPADQIPCPSTQQFQRRIRCQPNRRDSTFVYTGIFILFALLSIDSINKVIYASKANWYIGSIKLMSFKTKKRIAARCAQDLYSSLARSISFSVCSETTNDSSIEVEVAFDDCSVLSKSRSSSRVSPATFSRLGRDQKKQRISYWSILSSSSLRVRLLDEIVKTRLSFCSSSCGFSFLTTIPKSWSSSPAHRIIRF